MADVMAQVQNNAEQRRTEEITKHKVKAAKQAKIIARQATKKATADER